MVVRIRLQRFGRRKLPYYRVVAADARCKRDGKCLERLGAYNPMPNPAGVKECKFNVERVKYWISVGAQPSHRVQWLLSQFGIMPRPIIPVAQTKYHIPKKIRREQKGKGFHTMSMATTPAVGDNDCDDQGTFAPTKIMLNMPVTWAKFSDIRKSSRSSPRPTKQGTESVHVESAEELPCAQEGWLQTLLKHLSLDGIRRA